MKRLFKFILISLFFLVLVIFSIDAYVAHSVKKQLNNNIQTIAHNRVGLVLGTSKYVSKGVHNLYYKYRIEAAVELYKAGKIDFILVSGDNRTEQYNEPQTMKKDLIAAGIPERHIFLDYAGFRTLDSIIRSNAVFTAGAITIISQRFHNERALFIANRRGVQAIAYNAQDPPEKYQIKVLLREKLARVKMMLDLLFNKQPKFFGDKVDIKEEFIVVDSIDNKPVSYYLDNAQVSQLAVKFLNKEFTPSDNDETDSLLHLVLTDNDSLRPFYRWCLNEVINTSDGALGEYPGSPARMYAEKFPKEFLSYMQVSQARYNSWVGIIAYSGVWDIVGDKVLNDNDLLSIKMQIINRMKHNCVNCTSDENIQIEKFGDDVATQFEVNFFE